MRYINSFSKFKISILEELQYSKNIEDQVLKDIKEICEKFKSSPTYNDTIKKSEITYLNRFRKEYVFSVSDIIYKKFPIALGACLLQKASETLYSRFSGKKTNEGLFQKKTDANLSSQKKSDNTPKISILDRMKEKGESQEQDLKKNLDLFDKKIQEALSKKSIELLPIKIENCKIKLILEPFHDMGGKFITLGSLGHIFEPSNGIINTYYLSLNLLEETVKEISSEDKTIRHELQHLTQSVNDFCLEIGEQYIKGNFKMTTDFIESCYNKSKKSYKIGLGKTKTGLKQRDEVGDFDAASGKKTNIAKAYSKIYNDESISSEEEKKIAKRLQYLGDDQEYKNWLHDKVSSAIDVWKEDNKDNLKFFKQDFRMKKLFASVFNEALTDVQSKKMQLRKEMKQLAKERNLSYDEIYRSIKNTNESEFIGSIVEFIMKDTEISIMAKLRKETSKDVTNLVRKRLEDFLSK